MIWGDFVLKSGMETDGMFFVGTSYQHVDLFPRREKEKERERETERDQQTYRGK